MSPEIIAVPKAHWWEVAKPYVECVGVVLLAVYTVFTIRIYCATEQAAKAAASSADTAAQSIHLDQRAWVGPREVIPPPPEFFEKGDPRFVKSGQPVTLGVRINNAGRSPALDVKARTSMKFIKASEAFAPDYQQAETYSTDSIYVVQPGMLMELASLPTKRAISDDEVKELKAGTWVDYVFGEITYDDIFKQTRHTTHFCLFVSRDLSKLTACHTYNDAD